MDAQVFGNLIVCEKTGKHHPSRGVGAHGQQETADDSYGRLFLELFEMCQGPVIVFGQQMDHILVKGEAGVQIVAKNPGRR